MTVWELTRRPMRADAPSVCHSVCATLWGAALAVCDDFPMSALMWSLDRIVWYCPVCLTILQSECRCKVTRVCWGLYCVCVLWLFILRSQCECVYLKSEDVLVCWMILYGNLEPEISCRLIENATVWILLNYVSFVENWIKYISWENTCLFW